jgi:hypothetical protein
MKRKYREAMRAKANRQHEMAADALRWFDENRARQDRLQNEQPKNEPRKMENEK